MPVAGPLASSSSITLVARSAERLGFDAIWVNDFIAWSSLQDGLHISSGSVEAVEAADGPPTFFESLTNLAYLAGVTTRPRLGVSVLCLPYRNPVVAAKQLANIDVLSQGRLTIGVGVGAAKTTHNSDFEVLGIPRATKYERSRDYLKAMQCIWTATNPSYEGDFVSFPSTQIYPKPVQRPYPPIWVGGSGPQSMNLAAELGTGWIPGWIGPQDYPRRIDELSDLAGAMGRGDIAFDIAADVNVCVARRQEDAELISRRTFEALGMAYPGEATADEIRNLALVGSPEHIAELLHQYITAGVGHFEMKFIYPTIDSLSDQLALFSESVMSAFNSE